MAIPTDEQVTKMLNDICKMLEPLKKISEATEEYDFFCDECGEGCDVLVEGYCADCHDRRQRELNEHIARYDAWQGMSWEQRDRAIRNACRIV